MNWKINPFLDTFSISHYNFPIIVVMSYPMSFRSSNIFALKKDGLILFSLSSCWEKEVVNAFINHKRGKLRIVRALVINKFFSFWQPANFFWKAELSQYRFPNETSNTLAILYYHTCFHMGFTINHISWKKPGIPLFHSLKPCMFILNLEKKNLFLFFFFFLLKKSHQNMLGFVLD